MNENLYTPFIYLGIFGLLATLAVGAVFYWLSEKSRKDMAAFMRHSHIESQKIQKEAGKSMRIAHRMIAEAHKTSRENALFLRMIFERVDKRNEPES